MQNFEVIVVDDRNVLDAIASIKRPISETFVRENYQQLSFSEEELRKKKTGILGTMFPPAWRNPDFSAGQADEEEAAAMQRPMPATPSCSSSSTTPAGERPPLKATSSGS